MHSLYHNPPSAPCKQHSDLWSKVLSRGRHRVSQWGNWTVENTSFRIIIRKPAHTKNLAQVQGFTWKGAFQEYSSANLSAEGLKGIQGLLRPGNSHRPINAYYHLKKGKGTLCKRYTQSAALSLPVHTWHMGRTRALTVLGCTARPRPGMPKKLHPQSNGQSSVQRQPSPSAALQSRQRAAQSTWSSLCGPSKHTGLTGHSSDKAGSASSQRSTCKFTNWSLNGVVGTLGIYCSPGGVSRLCESMPDWTQGTFRQQSLPTPNSSWWKWVQSIGLSSKTLNSTDSRG